MRTFIEIENQLLVFFDKEKRKEPRTVCGRKGTVREFAFVVHRN
jgi:hypothetical protein